MFKKIAIGALVLVVLTAGGFYAYCSSLPDSYQVERSLVINASAAEIFALVADLERWPTWSAWTKEKYPSLEYSYGDVTRGVGAVQNWTAEDGTGRLEITSAEPDRGISYDLTFDETMKSEGLMSFSPVEGGIQVSWVMKGKLEGAVAKFMGQFFDRLMGPDFESGLANLKALAEKS